MIEYLIKILLDGKEAASEANRAGRAISELDTTVMRVGKSILGMFALDRIKESVVQTIEWADAMNDAAKKVGIASEQMQLFNLAAKQTGTDIASITQAMKFLAQNMAEATNKETSEAALAFQQLRVSMDQVRGLRPDQMFLVLSERVRLLPDSVQKTSAALTLLGRTAQDLFPAMREGFAEATKKAKELHAVVSEADMEALEALKKKSSTLGAQLQARTAQGVAKVAPFAGRMMDVMTSSLAYEASGSKIQSDAPNELGPLVAPNIKSRANAYKLDLAQAILGSGQAAASSKEPDAAAKLVELQKLTVDELRDLKREVKKAL